MAGYVQRGEALDYVNTTGSTIANGTPVAIGTHVGIAGSDIAAGATGALHVVGVFKMDKLTTEDIALGDKLYLDANKKATKTAGSLTTVIGYAVAAAAQADATVLARLCD